MGTQFTNFPKNKLQFTDKKEIKNISSCDRPDIKILARMICIIVNRT